MACPSLHVRTAAHAFAQRLLPAAEKSSAEAVRQGYLATIARQPDETELAAATSFLAAQEQRYADEQKPNPQELALADFCQVLFGLNEFVYVE